MSPEEVRRNGWQRPLHPMQFVLWTCIIFFGVAGFGFLFPALPGLWQTVSYACLTVLYVINFVFHIMTVSVDPGEAQNGVFNPLKCVWDSQSCSIRIERLECGPGTSVYCPRCNKFVENYDHHCIWLNNCIGRRNYRFFVTFIVTGFLAVTHLCVTALYILSMYFIMPRIHGTGTYAEITELLVPARSALLGVIPINSMAATLLAVALITAVLGLIAFIVLGNLVGLHTYMSCVGLTFSEFMTQRSSEDSDSDVEAFMSEVSNTPKEHWSASPREKPQWARTVQCLPTSKIFSQVTSPLKKSRMNEEPKQCSESDAVTAIPHLGEPVSQSVNVDMLPQL